MSLRPCDRRQRVNGSKYKHCLSVWSLRRRCFEGSTRRRRAPWRRRERGRRRRSIGPSWPGTTRRTSACSKSGKRQSCQTRWMRRGSIIIIFIFFSVRFRMTRIQKENEQAELSKLEAALRREQEQQEFMREREKEILQLQVRLCVWFVSFIVLMRKRD